MREPQRIRLRRVAGWRMPEHAVSVARPSRWANPWRPGGSAPNLLRLVQGGDTYERFLLSALEMPAANTEEAINLFESYAAMRSEMEPAWLAPLRGKHLACWCPEDFPCHADVLLKLANASEVTP